jgi:PAS domain S-box-containing protein
MLQGIRKSLTLKWMIFSILLATIPLAIAGFSIIQIYQKDLKKSVIGIEEMKASMVVERTEAFFEKITSNLFTLVNDEDFKIGHSSSHVKNLLENLLYQNDTIWELALLDKRGKEVVKVSKYGVIGPNNLESQAKSEMFGVASKGKTYYGGFYLTKDIVPTMGIAVPVDEYKREPVGVLSAKIHLRYLWNLVPQIQIGKEGFTYVVDKDGNLIAHPDTRRVLLGLNVRSLPVVDQVVSGKEGHLEFDHPEGERVLCAYKLIKKLGWGVIVQVPVNEAYAPLRKVAHTAFIWILIGLAIAVILSLFLTRKFTLPIKRLSSGMGEIAKGNLDTYIQTATKDEVGLLTESYNLMIRDLKQSREALKGAEERYRRIFEKSKDMVYITSLDGKFTDVNQAGVEILGYESKEKLMGIFVKDIYLHQEDREKFIHEMTVQGFAKDFEAKLKKADGTLIDTLMTASLRKDEEGNILGYEGIIKDISFRKRMEYELVQKKEELQALYDMGVLINQTLDLDIVLPNALDRVCSLTGYEMGGIYLFNEIENILELKYNKGYTSGFAESVKVIKFGEGVAGKILLLKQPVIFSIDEYPTPQFLPFLKEEGIQSLVGIPLMSKGKAIGAITLSSRSIHTLNQRKVNLLESIGNQIGLALENAQLFSNVAKTKSEWETTFNAVTDLITIRDKDYRIIRANKGAFERFGLTPEQMIGKRCFEALHQSDQPCEGCYVSKTLETKKPLSGERDSKYLNGIFQYYTFPIFDEEGEVVAVVDLAREITEEKRLEIEKEVVNSVNKIIVSSLDVRQVIKDIHSEIKKVFDSERMTITLLDEGGEGFQYFALEKDYEAKELAESMIYPKKGTPFEKVADLGLPVIVPDTKKYDSWFDQKLLKEGIRSSLVFPLEFRGKIIGTMNFGSKESHHFSNHQITFLHSIAPGLAILIQNALLFEETKKRLSELTLLYEIMRISASNLNLDQMLEEIIYYLNSFFKFEAFGIVLVDEKTSRLVIHPSFIGHPIKDIERLELCLGKGITGWVAERGAPLLVNDVRSDFRYISYDDSIGSEMCVPLKVGQKVVGVLDAQSRVLNAFSNDDLRLLGIVGGQLAILVENLRLYEGIKKSEEKYRTVIEGAHDGICVIGKDNRFKYVNRREAELQGLPQEKLVGMDFCDFLDEASRQVMADRFIRWGKEEKLPPRFELNILRKDGEIRNVEINARVIKDSNGDVNYVVFTKDITEKKKMEDQLLQAEKLRALAEMASGVAHDFNNALAAILGNTQLLLFTAQDEELKETLRIIEKVAKESAKTVRRLQDFTRKRVQQELFKVDVNSIIRDSIEITKPKWKDEAQRKGRHVEIASSLEEVPPVSGSTSELREVMTNMIFNAIEAMPEGGKIEIRTFQKGREVFIQISDSGIGITEDARKKIFEPFFTTKPFTNTGLGLSMSYGIIKRFGGEIEVQSKVGHGTTFTILLPIGRDQEEEATFPSAIKKGKKARILVIDDEEFVRSVLSRTLAQVHHQVTLAEDGEKGIQLFKEEKFDMVLTDLGMPGMSGWDVCRIIKKISPHTPVGMITGWGAEMNQSKIEEYGLDFFISKPFDFNQVLNVVAETMKSKEERLLS